MKRCFGKANSYYPGDARTSFNIPFAHNLTVAYGHKRRLLLPLPSAHYIIANNIDALMVFSSTVLYPGTGGTCVPGD